MAFLVLVLTAALAWAQMPSAPAAVEAGRQIYMGSCSGCHGATGEGSQGPSLLSGRASRLPDKALFLSIRNGLPGTSMPDFPMEDEKVWQVAAFVRSMTAPAVEVQVAGDAARGRAFFFGEGKCSGCHMILGQGGYPGPDLSNIGAERTLYQLRESILKPSARIADGFRAASAVLRGGRIVRGVAKNFNNYSVQILDSGGRLHLLRRSELEKVELMDASLMPPMKSAEAAPDLIAFLARRTTRIYEGASR
ncbi:MAG: c-type cytochrome [Bryobacteraceae bacterium]